MKQTAVSIGITTAAFCLSFFFSYHNVSQGLSGIKPASVKQFHSASHHNPDILALDKEPGPETNLAAGNTADENPPVQGVSTPEGGSFIQTMDEYIADALARTPHEELAKRTVELAGMLYSKDKERARDLLESSVIESAQEGDPLYQAALNFLRDIYSAEASPDGYKRLLAGMPKSYPGRVAVVHEAGLAYVERNEIGRAYSLLVSELADNRDDQMLFCDLATVYEQLPPAPEAADREEEETAAVHGDARIFYSLGNHYLLRGEDELARRAFDNAAKLDPSYAVRTAPDTAYPSEDRQCKEG